MSTREQELKRLIELKKLQEELQVLNKKDMQEKIKLERAHLDYLNMDSRTMVEAIQKGPMPEVGVKSKAIDPIINDYKAQYSGKEWYKEPEVKDGKTYLTFPSEEEIGKFFTGQAEKERPFTLIDAQTNKVLAYSNGDGKLYNGSGKEYEGGKFEPSTEDFSSFKIPEPESSSASMRL